MSEEKILQSFRDVLKNPTNASSFVDMMKDIHIEEEEEEEEETPTSVKDENIFDSPMTIKIGGNKIEFKLKSKRNKKSKIR